MGINHLAAFDSVDTTWLLFCTCLLIFMQAGFSCLESGAIRSKNSINVVMKNSADLCISVALFMLLGFGMMFLQGNAFSGIPNPLAAELPAHYYLVFLFHAMFCATAVTIISGAVAERMSFHGYLVLAVITAGFIYPIAGRWVWGGLLFPVESAGWLAQLGFHDFAGATVVHSVGGWVALAAVITIGPRLGRFGSDARPIEASSLPISALGVFLLWIGWLGFNGGSALKVDSQTPVILLITVVGGIAGIATSLMSSYLKYHKPRVMLMMNGGLCGLVSVTGAADILTLWEAVLVGAIGGLLPISFDRFLEKRGIDDAIGVIPVHLAGGIWGTLVAGMVVPTSETFSRSDALMVQFLGIVIIGMFAFFSAFGLLYLAKRLVQLRVSAAAEMIGLNIWEHDATTSHLDLIRQMAAQANSGQFEHPIAVEPQTDAFHIAAFYNSVLDRFNDLQLEKDKVLQEAIWLSEHDPLTGLCNRRAVTQALDSEHTRVSRYGKPAVVAILDIDHFKEINDNHGHDAGDTALKHIAQILQNETRASDTVGRIGGEEFCLLLTETNAEEAKIPLHKLLSHIANSPVGLGQKIITVTASIGFAQMDGSSEVSSVLKKADRALYEAKRKGRNCIELG